MPPIPKPKMRGLLADQIQRSVIISILLSMPNVIAYKIFVLDKRQQLLNDYYLDFDPEVSVEYMRKHLQSASKGNSEK